MLVGECLKKLRLFLGLTQKEMSQGIVSESFYSRVERGTRKIKIVDLLALLNKNGIHLKDFFNEDISNQESDIVNSSINSNQFEILTVKLSQGEMLENKASEIRELAKIAFIFLRTFYQKGLIDETKKVIKLIETFPPYPLLAVYKLVAQYYQGLIEKDSLKVEQIRELIKLSGCEESLLKDLPKL
ncbi:helix-turn-helix domain-containing protein [Lactobacillus sp. PSON]|uniref:helix-turn-helix domain-containing protein n=1 Tax=Lactobacillus sp. PSON TaxID=3455454 RepID=UPI0040428D89